MTERAISPVRRRMDISENATRLRARVKDLATFVGRSLGTAEAEDVRRFRLHLTASGAGTSKINATPGAGSMEIADRLRRARLLSGPRGNHDPTMPRTALRIGVSFRGT